MLQKCRKMLKNEKGLTLIELLAVVVILGIIAAIAIPSIGGIIEKSRTDSYKADAQQVMSAARLAIISDTDLAKEATIPFEKLNTYLENFDKTKYEDSIIITLTAGKVSSVSLTPKGKTTPVVVNATN